MNKELQKLNPVLVWKHFAAMLDIPHPSHHEVAIREYFKSFAASKALDCVEDEAGNVLIRKGATAGMEDRATIVLQAHMDMVPQKNNDTVFDFERDAVQAYVDGDWVRANGTTLGADNGIGVAAALAILEDDSVAHPALEVLLTSNEECGMDGAFGLSPELLQGEILLNLDTEDEGELCIGCAGGLDLEVKFDHEREESPKAEDGDYRAKRLTIKGLKGGHSGCQIHEQRANANKLLFRLLRFTKLELLISKIDGGSLRNAIPREAYADILIHSEDEADFTDQVARFEAMVAKEYAAIEDSISITLSDVDYPATVIEESAASCIVWAIAGCPDGVAKMSDTMPGLVQTSSNLAIVKTSDDGTSTSVELFLRSSSESEKIALADSIASIFELADAEVTCGGSHPGWLPNIESPILKAMKDSYLELFGKEAEVRAVHAGLECGIIGATYPEMDMISFGPTIVSPHSPDECAQISTVDKFYQLLKYTLKNAPKSRKK
ncbi:MAG: aminoacyl-histidine dipeptidase [Rikenellaceae bacterium]